MTLRSGNPFLNGLSMLKEIESEVALSEPIMREITLSVANRLSF